MTQSSNSSGLLEDPPNEGPPPKPSRDPVWHLDSSALPKEERTAFHIYLREIGQIPLLTPDEEVEVALLIQKGDEAARELMIKANLRLVVKIARDYEGYGVPLLDLINEGNIGLMRAVEKFDPTKGAKLSSYSALWIKQSIRRALANQGRDIRLPVHVHEKLLRLRTLTIQLQEKLGRRPTTPELAEAVGLPTNKVALLLDSSRHPAYLNANLEEDESGNELGNVIQDEHALDPFNMLDRANMFSLLEQFTEDLKPREQQILGWRFGLQDGIRRTLEEIGTGLGLTREAVRQIQNRALEKLRKRFNRLNGPLRPMAAA